MKDIKHLINKISLYEQIANSLEEVILSGEMQEYDKLPSEQSLADTFGVSRNVIRESLKILKERGLIDSKNGVGSYITIPRARNISDVINRMYAMNNMSFKDVYDLRIILETASCERAAKNLTSEEIENMEDILEKLKNRNISVEERRELDFDFHIAIAKASGNELLVVFVKTMKNVFIPMIEKGIFVEGGIDDACIRHRKIMNSLKSKDPNEAIEMMKQHLEYSKMNVGKYYETMEKDI